MRNRFAAAVTILLLLACMGALGETATLRSFTA